MKSKKIWEKKEYLILLKAYVFHSIHQEMTKAHYTS